MFHPHANQSTPPWGVKNPSKQTVPLFSLYAVVRKCQGIGWAEASFQVKIVVTSTGKTGKSGVFVKKDYLEIGSFLHLE